jgi:hypothetical protein
VQLKVALIERKKKWKQNADYVLFYTALIPGYNLAGLPQV